MFGWQKRSTAYALCSMLMIKHKIMLIKMIVNINEMKIACLCIDGDDNDVAAAALLTIREIGTWPQKCPIFARTNNRNKRRLKIESSIWLKKKMNSKKPQTVAIASWHSYMFSNTLWNCICARFSVAVFSFSLLKAKRHYLKNTQKQHKKMWTISVLRDFM